LDREAVLMAIISAEGDLAAAIATLTDPANVSRSNRQPSPRRDYHPQVPCTICYRFHHFLFEYVHYGFNS